MISSGYYNKVLKNLDDNIIKMKFLLAIFLFLATTIIAYAENNDSSKQYLIKEHAEPLQVTNNSFFDQEEKTHTLQEFENKVVLLSIWATWCTFCTSKIKSLDELSQEIKSEDLKIIALSEDFKGIEVVSSLYKQKKIKNLEIFIDKKNTLFKSLNVMVLPTTLIINNKGQEVARIIGVIDWKTNTEAKELLKKYLKS